MVIVVLGVLFGSIEAPLPRQLHRLYRRFLELAIRDWIEEQYISASVKLSLTYLCEKC